MIDGVTFTQLDPYTDARGWSIRPFDESRLANGDFASCHAVSLLPGAVRGNHFHKEQTEDIVLVSGVCEFAALNPETGERFGTIVSGEKLFRITISPGIAHAFKNISDTIVYLFCVGDINFDPGAPDVFAHKVI